MIQGKNGSGKSSLISCLISSEKPSRGQVLMDEHNLHRLSRTDRQQFMASTGVVFQYDTLRPFDTVRKALSHHKAEKLERERMLKFLGFENRARSLVKTLSFAERRRLDLGRSLVHQPQLLVWDEPFLALDRHWKQQFLQALKELKDLGTTMIVATVSPENFQELYPSKIIQL